jgi:ribosomal protein S18 acetylase RimI-like enzyme
MTPCDWAWRFEAELAVKDDLRVRASASETTLRPLDVGDLAAVHYLAQRMSWPHRPEDCAQLLKLGTGIAAVDADGSMIGVALQWGFGRDAGTVGMVMVAREFQGKGIGRTLMEALIAQSAPRALMLNATVEGQGLYKKLGFSPVGLVHQHQGHMTEAKALPPAPTVSIRRALPADHVALCALDASAFGADRSVLILQMLAEGKAWLVDGAAGPVGFAIQRVFGRGTMIGPIVASTEDEAIALVATAAQAAPGGLMRVDIPASAERLAHWLAMAGLPVVDRVTMMLRGRWPATNESAQRFGLALQAVG